jgi:hypothetical protein
MVQMATKAAEYKIKRVYRADAADAAIKHWLIGAKARTVIACTIIGLAQSRRMRIAPKRTRRVTDKPLDLDKHRGMAAQKATDIRRILADVETNARDLRDRQAAVESQLLSAPAASWPEAAAKAGYVLSLYTAGLASDDTHHRDLVAAVLDDFARLSEQG